MNEFKAARDLENLVPKARKVLSKLINFNKLYGRKAVAIRAVAGTMDLTGGTGSGKIRGAVSKFKAPSRREIEKYANIMFESDVLDQMEMTLAVLEGSSNAAYKKRADQIRPIYEAMEEEFDVALNHLHELADAKAPAEVVKFFKQATTATSKVFETAVRDLGTLSQIDISGDKILFARFIDLDGLIEGDPYYAVWIAEITSNGDFNSIEYGTAVVENFTALRNIATAEVKATTPRALEVAISKELSIHKITLITNRVPLETLDSNKIAKVLGNSADAYVDDYEIRVETDDPQDVYLRLKKIPEIVQLVKKHRAKFRMVEEGGGYTYYIER